MPSHGYEEIEHTADLALRIWGEDYYSLLEQGAQGMYSLMGVQLDLESEDMIESFIIQRDSPETELVDFLQECLYLLEQKMIAFKTFSFRETQLMIHVQGQGKPISSIEKIIKAVTFHNLEIYKQEEVLETTIVFDV